MKLIVAITGASGAGLGQRFIEKLPKEVEVYAVVSDHAKVVLNKEENITIYHDKNIAASIASGSFKSDAMIIIPCSMNTLAKIACGISDNLTTRAASVMIKEQRKLILSPREMPFSPIALENMLKLGRLNVVIAPPVIGYYAHPETIEDMEDFLIGKWFDLLDIEHNLFKRWK
ncbi:MAG: UbiX family flavin prenyltransferase [Epsilonproteobacteria bacterium]|nr:UbiX family flavin prenyltransferase [Campylobacterota bacterium]